MPSPSGSRKIGELAKRLTPQALEQMPGVDWRGLKGMREILAHDHMHAQIAIISSVVDEDLPLLEVAVRHALAR